MTRHQNQCVSEEKVTYRDASSFANELAKHIVDKINYDNEKHILTGCLFILLKVVQLYHEIVRQAQEAELQKLLQVHLKLPNTALWFEPPTIGKSVSHFQVSSKPKMFQHSKQNSSKDFQFSI